MIESGLEMVESGLEWIRDGLEWIRDGLEWIRDGLEWIRDGLEWIRDGLGVIITRLEKTQCLIKNEYRHLFDTPNYSHQHLTTPNLRIKYAFA